MKVNPNPLLGTLPRAKTEVAAEGEDFSQLLAARSRKFSKGMTKAAINNPYITRPDMSDDDVTKLIKQLQKMLQELLLSFGLTKDPKLLAEIKRVQQAIKDLQGGIDTSELENLYNRD